MEKTFEELIADKVTQQQTRDGQYTIYPDDALELMHQVREATKAECLEIAAKGYYWASTYKKIELLPTDRIRLTEKK